MRRRSDSWASVYNPSPSLLFYCLRHLVAFPGVRFKPEQGVRFRLCSFFFCFTPRDSNHATSSTQTKLAVARLVSVILYLPFSMKSDQIFLKFELTHFSLGYISRARQERNPRNPHIWTSAKLEAQAFSTQVRLIIPSFWHVFSC